MVTGSRAGVGWPARARHRPGATAHHNGGDQGADGAEQEAERRRQDGDRLDDQSGGLADAVLPGRYLFPGGQVLARCEAGEYGQPGGQLRVGPEQAGFDAVKPVQLAVVKTHRVLLWQPTRGAGPGVRRTRTPGVQRRAGRRMATAAKPTATRAMSTPPATLLDQNIGSAMENFWLRMGPAMISQAPSSRVPTCRPANPRGLIRAKAPSPATASPEIRLTVLALVPVFCSVRNQGDRATQTPVSSPSTADACAPMSREVTGSP